ncbi:Lin1244/Lin1753 domain-containing protein [Bacillus altitudinis]|uniref:Lin1244/Lin1753 domain-containing protein n=1 Tax=Bacillus altitudinis TaxID=293387 RepID=UPI00366CCA7C
MARPLKESLDYFPIDIGFDEDDKLSVTIAKYGMQGLGIIIKIMAEVYKNSYFYPWTEQQQYPFAQRINVDINLVMDVVNECIKWGFFNRKVFEEHGVLTSRGFQKRYVEAAKRRKLISIVDDYLLIDPAVECKNVSHSITIVKSDGNTVNVYINPDKCNNVPTQIPQSKVKESKVKKSKVEERKEQPKEEVLPDGDPLFQPLGTDSSSRNPDEINLFDIFQREGFGTISPFTSDKIQTLEKEYGARWVQEAMKIAALNGKRKLVYVDGILINWKADGIDEPWTKEAPPGNGGNKSKGRNGKPIIDVVQPVTDPDQSGITDEEYEEMMRYAAELQANKQQEVPH